LRVGINVSGLLVNGGYSKDNMFGLKSDYADLMRRLIRHFASRPETEVHLVAHVISDTFPVEDDLKACEMLCSELPDTVSGNVVVAPRFATPSEAKSYIAGLDFFTGARMHACIAAFSSGVPVVPMAYSRKFAGLFGALGYLHTVDCTNDSADRIESYILESFERRAFLRSEVQVALSTGLDRLGLYEGKLQRLMEESIGGVAVSAEA
jgi:polysaccharide pyruvyl transferase WcaK-like protein